MELYTFTSIKLFIRHIKLLEWIEANEIPAHYFKPSYPKTKEDLPALTKINASFCNISGKQPLHHYHPRFSLFHWT